MKKLKTLTLWAFFALFCTNLQAQVDTTGPQDILDTIFSQVDTSILTTGLLSDKTLSLYVKLDDYDGKVDKAISFNEMMTLPFVLEHMQVKNIKVPDKEKIITIYNQHHENNLIVPLIFDYEYQKISDSAFIKGLIDTSGAEWQDTMIGGVSPYQKQQLKAICFDRGTVFSGGFRFMFDPALYFSNKSNPGGLDVDFDDGKGLVHINAYDTITVNYNDTLTHLISIGKSTGVDQTEHINFAEIKAKEYRIPIADCTFFFEPNDILYGYTEKTIVTGYDAWGEPITQVILTPEYYSAYVSIKMGKDRKDGTPHTCLKKPLIFVDGINFGYKHHVDEFFPNALKYNDLGFQDIAEGLMMDPITGVTEADPRFAEGPDLIRRATDAGYDVIFIDFKYGAGDIYKNGLLLEEFIIRMNDGTLTGSSCYCGKTYDEIVLLGASGGGQATRYALLDMEKKNIPHCVREWISFDSPNGGANIPLGLQSFVEWTARQNKATFNLFESSKDALNRKLDRYAAKQLLIYHHTYENQSKPASEFDNFFPELNMNFTPGGMPVKCRKAAICNGSITANRQDENIPGKLPMFSGDKLVNLNLPLKWTIVDCSYFADFFATGGAPLSKDMCDKNISGNFVFNGKSEYKRYAWSKTVSECKTISFSGVEYDYVPGGTDNGLMSMNMNIFGIGLKASHDFFCFIPTVSALAIYPDVWKNNGGGMFNIRDNFGAGNIKEHLPNYNITPFDAIFGPDGQNEAHVNISSNLIDWTLEELLRGDYESDLTDNSTAGNTYNFGSLYFNRLKSITVNRNCFLKVFANDAVGYKNRKPGYEEQYYTRPTPADNATFDLYTAEGCSDTYVKINADGMLELGDGNNRKAIAHFRAGSTLELMDGATLWIKDGSAVVIEKGARIIYHKGCRVILDGENAQLQIQGLLEMPDPSTEFTFTHNPQFVHNGYVHFVNSPDIYVNGTNNTIKLEGADHADKLVKVTGGELRLYGFHRNAMNCFASVSLRNGEVEVGGGSKISCDASIDLNNVSFDGSFGLPSSNTGIEVFGQDGISADRCYFNNLEFGLKLSNMYSISGLPQRFNNDIFSGCKTGLDIVMMPTEISLCRFTHCESGIHADYCQRFKVEGSYFADNQQGLLYSAGNGYHGLVKECEFLNNLYGIQQTASNSSITIACTVFTGNIYAIDAFGDILMSRMLVDPNYATAGGNCSFVNNFAGIGLHGGWLNIDEGGNNFIEYRSRPSINFITGMITIPGGGLAVHAENNYWYPSPVVQNNHYFLFTGSMINTVILLTNPSLTAMNAMCYHGQVGNGTGTGGQVTGGGDIIIMPPPNSDGTSIEKMEHTGTDETIKLTAFPDPCNTELHITAVQGILPKPDEILVSSVDGRIFYPATEIRESEIRINTEMLENGIYLVILKYGTGTHTEKFVVMH
jgi:hypothetical protein